MKTAMQEFIEEITKNYPMIALLLHQKAIDKKYLEKEKQQIIEGHWAGWNDAYDYLNSDSNDRARQAEDYYEETYN